MTRSVEKKGRTVEEAVGLALGELGAQREDVVIKVLEEGNRGFLGLLGAKAAVVLVRTKESKAEAAARVVREVIDAMDVKVSVEVNEDDEYIFVDVRGDEASKLIGRHGQTLDALQYLVNVASAKGRDGKARVVVDVEGYRRRREDTLRRLASRLADRVRRTGESITLEPMSPHERRVIHLALQNHSFVATHSEGEEPYRKVIIASKR